MLRLLKRAIGVYSDHSCRLSKTSMCGIVLIVNDRRLGTYEAEMNGILLLLCS